MRRPMQGYKWEYFSPLIVIRERSWQNLWYDLHLRKEYVSLLTLSNWDSLFTFQGFLCYYVSAQLWWWKRVNILMSPGELRGWKWNVLDESLFKEAANASMDVRAHKDKSLFCRCGRKLRSRRVSSLPSKCGPPLHALVALTSLSSWNPGSLLFFLYLFF